MSMLKTALNTNIIPHIWKLNNIVPSQNASKHIQGYFIQAHIPPLRNCQETGEEPYSLHNSKQPKLPHAIRVQNTTLHSDGTIHIKQYRSKGVQAIGSPCATNHCSTRYEQSFRRNKHTHPNQKAVTDIQTKIPDTIIKFMANYIKRRKSYTTYRYIL